MGTPFILNDDSLTKMIRQGEDSLTEFKQEMINKQSLIQSIVAFLNQEGGTIIFGVDDNKNIVGIEEPKEIEELIKNCRNQIKPVPSIFVTNHILNEKTVVSLNIVKGENQPYATNDGKYFIRHGASKKQMSHEELMRAFQKSGKLHAEEMVIKDSSFDDINLDCFKNFYKKKTNKELSLKDDELKITLSNIKCFQNGKLTLLGALLFCDEPQKFFPLFNIKAVAFNGITSSVSSFRSKRDIDGNLSAMYGKAINFILSNMPRIQTEENFNSIGEVAVSEVVLGELLVNALIHRDYFISSSIRIFIFDDRIEIKSPGKLPNHLTIENIKSGVAMPRNSILSKYAGYILPYTGIGSGIGRVLEENPSIEFIENKEIEEFTAIIPLLESSFLPQSKEKNIKDEQHLDIKLNVDVLIGYFNDLKDEMLSKSDNKLKQELEVIEKSLNEFEDAYDKHEMLKTGALSKFARFLEKLDDTSSDFGKVLNKIEKGHKILSELAQGYNNIVEWIALPQIPKFLLKKKK